MIDFIDVSKRPEGLNPQPVPEGNVQPPYSISPSLQEKYPHLILETVESIQAAVEARRKQLQENTISSESLATKVAEELGLSLQLVMDVLNDWPR